MSARIFVRKFCSSIGVSPRADARHRVLALRASERLQVQQGSRLVENPIHRAAYLVLVVGRTKMLHATPLAAELNIASTGKDTS